MSYQRRSSRPSSAASYSSRTSAHSDGELKLECRAVFLGHYDDIRDEIESKDDLIMLLQESGRNATNKIISKYWTRNTESMTFDEFVDVCRREPVTSEDDLMRAFRKIDINGDGYISLDELFKIMTTKGEKMSRAEVRDMIDEVDENKDGKLDYKEFAKMVVSSTEDYKKMSIKVMEKKEKRKLKKRDGDVSPRKEISPIGRRLSRLSFADEVDDELSRPSPRGRRESRPKSAGKGGRNDPANLREWTALHSKGTFFLEDGGVVSHVYNLHLTEDTEVYITIQPLKIGESGESLDGTVIDTALFVLSEDDNSFVAFTENKDNDGKYSLRCSLSMGSYTLIPFTTGCRLRARKDMPTREAKLIADKDGKIVLTRAFRKGLEEIFEMADLDGNGLLSRDEFNWYNLRTSGEEVGDDEWQVVEDNIELEKGELTRSGFIKLNEMEADDNEGDTDDLWVTMTSMGFNKSLILDEACPFLLKVYAQDCPDPELKVTALESSKDKINNAACDFVIAKGEATKVKGMKDLTLYQYVCDFRASIVVENKSKSKVKMRLDCSKHRNIVSHTGSLSTVVTVPPMSSVVGHHILPLDDGREFNVSCEESILK